MTPTMTPEYLAQAPANWGYELGPMNTQNAFDLLAMFQELEATYPLTFASLFADRFDAPMSPAANVICFIVYNLTWMHTEGSIPSVEEFIDIWADHLCEFPPYISPSNTGDPE